MPDNPYSSLTHDMNTLPSNHGDEKVDEEIKPVARGERHTPVSRKIIKAIFAEDIENIREYFVYDVLIPALKKALDETVHSMLYGQSSGKDNHRDYASYSDYYSRSRESRRDRDREPVRKKAQRFDNEFFFTSRGDAEDTLIEMKRIIRNHGVCTVADLCRLARMSSDWTDNDYGWHDVTGVRVKPYRGGFVLDLPTAHLVD